MFVLFNWNNKFVLKWHDHEWNNSGEAGFFFNHTSQELHGTHLSSTHPIPKRQYNLATTALTYVLTSNAAEVATVLTDKLKLINFLSC